MTTAGSIPIPNNWINDCFGSKRGLLNYSLFETKRLVGLYSPLKIEKGIQPKRLVFLCMGNICRSPLAEAVAKSLGFDAISYGLKTRGGDTADPRAIKFADSHGLNLTNHRTRRIDSYIVTQGDLIIGMEPKHLQLVNIKESGVVCTLLGMYSRKGNIYIHDPFNTNKSYFLKCEETIVEATKKLIDHVK